MMEFIETVVQRWSVYREVVNSDPVLGFVQRQYMRRVAWAPAAICAPLLLSSFMNARLVMQTGEACSHAGAGWAFAAAMIAFSIVMKGAWVMAIAPSKSIEEMQFGPLRDEARDAVLKTGFTMHAGMCIGLAIPTLLISQHVLPRLGELLAALMG